MYQNGGSAIKYTKITEPHGDGIARTLRKLRAQYGDAWTDAMAEYAIAKSYKLPMPTWREAVPNGVKAPARQYIKFEAV